MKQVHFEVKQDGTIRGEELLLKSLRRKPGKYRAEIYDVTRRTLKQNAYMHCIFDLMRIGFYNAGWEHVTTMERAKAECKRLFLTHEVVNKKTGEVKEFIKDTHELTKEECSLFIDAIIQHAAEFLGIVIPTPEEYNANNTKWDLSTLAA